MKQFNGLKTFSVALIGVWLSIFAFGAFIIVLFTSFQGSSVGFTLHHYSQLLNSIYLKLFERSLWVASLSTFFCLVLGYPMAYIISRSQPHLKSLFLLLLIIPFWTSSLVRSYAMLAILKTHGIINSFLMSLGMIASPLPLLFSNTALIVGLVYNLLPFMIFPIFANLEQFDFKLIEAAKDLGANRLTIFKKIIIPLTMPGILSGCILVFLPAMTLFYIPDLLGGAKSILLGNLISQQFLTALNWPLGSASSVLLTAIMGLFLLLYWRVNKAQGVYLK